MVAVFRARIALMVRLVRSEMAGLPRVNLLAHLAILETQVEIVNFLVHRHGCVD